MNVAFVIPAYKKPLSLERLLDSIHAHTHKKHSRTIVVYDDGTPVEPLKKKFPWVTVVSTGNIGSGAVATIRQGVDVAWELDRWQYQIVGVLGDDCELVTDDTDEMIYEYFCDKPDTAVAGFNDGIQGGRAHPFMMMDFWRRGGGFCPDYKHYYCDTETQRIALYYNEWIHMEDCRIIHHHEYCQKKGMDVEILEDQSGDAKRIASGDGPIFEARIAWWENNRRPRTIPYGITQ